MPKWLRGVTLPSDASLPSLAAFLGLPIEEVRELRGTPRQRLSATRRLTLSRRLEEVEDRLDALAARLERLTAQVESRRR